MKKMFKNLFAVIAIVTLMFTVFSVNAAGKGLSLKSSAAIVMDQETGMILYEKKSKNVMPIASITKLMTAMVLLDSKPNLNKSITISKQDIDTLRHSRSRLPVGTKLTLREMMRLALMSSDNRAASALSRSYPGGKPAFVKAMNRKARALGLKKTRFRDPTGLYTENKSTARDLAKLVAYATKYPLIRTMTTTESHTQKVGKQLLKYNNTNILTKNPNWKIGLSKTGFINESGKCLVMQTWINNRPTIVVLLNSWGQLTPVGDSNRIKEWMSGISVAELQKRG
ncbi:serine hydrolase [Methylotuvimicrobium sp. KM1]|uniref:serine hydrolase n=1 Tax=Methylotuvimicrobium sp. KM1 TaxID=3377707 RepID=UPI00384D4227